MQDCEDEVDLIKGEGPALVCTFIHLDLLSSHKVNAADEWTQSHLYGPACTLQQPSVQAIESNIVYQPLDLSASSLWVAMPLQDLNYKPE